MSITKPPSIDNEHDYQKTISSLSKQDKPPRILCFLMNILETYRQSRKMGWSRAWNKYGVITFQSFKLNTDDDSSLIQNAENMLQTLPNIPAHASIFMRELLYDEQQFMGFIFISEYTEGTHTTYESATLSFGSKTKNNPRGRERFDIIFDCPVIHGVVKPLSRIRLYVDPYREGEKSTLYQNSMEAPFSSETLALFQQLCDCSWQWHDQQDKLWHHWTSNYIDYFGTRQTALKNSHFYLEHGERIASETTCNTP